MWKSNAPQQFLYETQQLESSARKPRTQPSSKLEPLFLWPTALRDNESTFCLESWLKLMTFSCK